MGILEVAEREYNKELEKAYGDGLDYVSYRNLVKNRNKLEKNGYRATSLYRKIDNLIKSLDNFGITRKFTDANREYIKNHSLILPIALCDTVVDDEMKKHVEVDEHNKDLVTLSIIGAEGNIIVSTLYNDYKPVGNVKYSSDIIKYFQDHHMIYHDYALELLCRVYGFELPKTPNYNHGVLDSKVVAYRAALEDPAIDQLIDISEEAAENKGIESFRGRFLQELYDEKREILDRARNGKVDPNFIYEPPKKYRLK